MIEENVKIHDKFSIEIKLGYGTKRSKKINDHLMSIWIFIPFSLDINRHTYKKEQFYSDLKTNLRLSTPVFLLREIADSEQSPFSQLEESFNKLAISPIRTNAENFEYQIRMFHSILKSSLRNEIQHLLQNKIEDDKKFLIHSLIQNIKIITEKYRKLRRIINTPTVKKEYFNYYLLSDEFMSNLIEQNIFKLLEQLKLTFPSVYEKNQGKLRKLIKTEYNYKEEAGLPVIKKGKPELNSDVIYRWGVLKKYFESILFLESRKRKDGVFIEQILYSIAAGLSMIFATAIAFTVQLKYGNFTIPLFIALVISYMLKDRIKELARFYFGGKVQKRMYDHKNTIRVKEKNKIGWCKESFDFVSEDIIPNKVKKIRNRSQTMEIEHKSANEKIILYRKFIRIDRRKLDETYKDYPITGISDIIRFNISNFIKQMDDPFVPAHVLTDDGIENINGEKLYHINFILKFQFEETSEYKRYKISFNRNGIKKIERFK